MLAALDNDFIFRGEPQKTLVGNEVSSYNSWNTTKTKLMMLNLELKKKNTQMEKERRCHWLYCRTLANSFTIISKPPKIAAYYILHFIQYPVLTAKWTNPRGCCLHHKDIDFLQWCTSCYSPGLKIGLTENYCTHKAFQSVLWYCDHCRQHIRS